MEFVSLQPFRLAPKRNERSSPQARSERDHLLPIVEHDTKPESIARRSGETLRALEVGGLQRRSRFYLDPDHPALLVLGHDVDLDVLVTVIRKTRPLIRPGCLLQEFSIDEAFQDRAEGLSVDAQSLASALWPPITASSTVSMKWSFGKCLSLKCERGGGPLPTKLRHSTADRLMTGVGRKEKDRFRECGAGERTSRSRPLLTLAV